MDALAMLKQAQDVYKQVKQKVLNVSPLEALVLECTCNEPWGPHGSSLHQLASASRGYEECSLIFSVLRMRMEDTGKDWRHVYKSLAVLEFLVGHGSESAMREVRSMKRELRHLERFQYIDPQGKDQGLNVRHKSQTLQRLLDDPQQIETVRKKARETKNKYTGVSSAEASSGFGGSGKKYGGFSSDDHFRATGGGSGGYDDDRRSSRNRDEGGAPSHTRGGAGGKGSTGAISLSSGGSGDSTTTDEWDAFGAERASASSASAVSASASAAAAAAAVAAGGAPRVVVKPRPVSKITIPLPAPKLPAPGAPASAAPASLPTRNDDLFGLDLPASDAIAAPAAPAAAAPAPVDLFGDFSEPPAAPAFPAVDPFALAPVTAPAAPATAAAAAAAAPAPLDLFGDFTTPAASVSHVAPPSAAFHVAPPSAAFPAAAAAATFPAPAAHPMGGDMFGGFAAPAAAPPAPVGTAYNANMDFFGAPPPKPAGAMRNGGMGAVGMGGMGGMATGAVPSAQPAGADPFAFLAAPQAKSTSMMGGSGGTHSLSTGMNHLNLFG